ncbi:putative hsp70 family protein [Piedraia hortae CBS 480.64]|uniref:Putative hsp70 family protein n=1 Tax=Piedraia hortae CBS 480.64 TaxID=1314780 RepID=A0A6A7BTT6_9PEZI|nr:putative hsp70 family protein [Piedraia hortae CBS 480.64]
MRSSSSSDALFPALDNDATENHFSASHDSFHSGADESSSSGTDRLIVGVDFGTTYSGVAAVYSANPDDVDIIKTWPGGNGITSDKVPTEIAYGEGTETEVRWGFQFRPEEPRLRCVKLFLDRNQRLPHFVSAVDTAAQLNKYSRTVMDAVSDYLTMIHGHTIETLQRRYGEAFVRSTKVEFVLTVPAVWSDAAKNATLVAAERAGMGDKDELKLISEPEAAAVYTLKTVQPGQLQVGDNFVVCDAGGGTVDLIAYRITSVNPLKVAESVVGTGGLCGSAFLNYRFEDHVRQRLGKETYSMMREKKPKTWMMGLRYFEEFVKRNFNEAEHEEVNVPFPGLPDDEAAGLDSGFLILTAAQVKEIMEPVIQQVIELVDVQVEAVRAAPDPDERHVSGIILVGGFGQSNYLYTRLKEHFAQDDGGIEILQPLNAWTAVVRGAVLRGLEDTGMVETRKTRYHYGTSYATVFEENVHPPEERYWSPLWERYMIGNRMHWHISKGTPISSTTPISFHYTRNFRPSQSLVVEDELIACAADMAPDAYSQDLISVCTLRTDLSAVPKCLFTRLTTTKGVEFDNLDFELQMRIESAELRFELRVDGQKYGDVSAEFR